MDFTAARIIYALINSDNILMFEFLKHIELRPDCVLKLLKERSLRLQPFYGLESVKLRAFHVLAQVYLTRRAFSKKFNFFVCIYCPCKLAFNTILDGGESGILSALCSLMQAGRESARGRGLVE